MVGTLAEMLILKMRSNLELGALLHGACTLAKHASCTEVPCLGNGVKYASVRFMQPSVCKSSSTIANTDATQIDTEYSYFLAVG